MLIKNSFPWLAAYSLTIIWGFSLTTPLPISLQRIHLHRIPFSFASCSTYWRKFVLSTPAVVTYVGISLWTLMIRQYSGTNLFPSTIISAASFVVIGEKMPFL